MAKKSAFVLLIILLLGGLYIYYTHSQVFLPLPESAFETAPAEAFRLVLPDTTHTNK